MKNPFLKYDSGAAHCLNGIPHIVVGLHVETRLTSIPRVRWLYVFLQK